MIIIWGNVHFYFLSTASLFLVLIAFLRHLSSISSFPFTQFVAVANLKKMFIVNNWNHRYGIIYASYAFLCCFFAWNFRMVNFWTIKKNQMKGGKTSCRPSLFTFGQIDFYYLISCWYFLFSHLHFCLFPFRFLFFFFFLHVAFI